MDEFAKMIYENWAKENEERNLFFNSGDKLMEELEEILSLDILNKIYYTFCDSCVETEQNAFIAGFSYACKCLSNGKIEFNK